MTNTPPPQPREGKAHREGDVIREGEAPAEPLFDSHLPTGSAGASPSQLHPSRRHPVHGIKFVDGQPTIIFDTLCIKNRRPILACEDFHRVFRDVATNATAWRMGRYVIMPDHIHFFAADVGGDIPYENWVTYLKSQLTKKYSGGQGSCRAVDGLRCAVARQEPRPPGVGPRGRDEFRWLTDHWDTRVRSSGAYEEKWQYFLNNPVRQGLVSKPEDWPFQGEIFELRWQ